ncbi:MAG: hypothetical protein DRP29_04215 [Thermodesulfobacteriota bacterium]|nr:MAG: hypothetical protein DRP29_04215 [Thermodesulfobacteriota bacterium]
MPLEPFMEKFDYMIGIEPVIYVNQAFVAAVPKHIITKNFLKSRDVVIYNYVCVFRKKLKIVVKKKEKR